MTLDKLHHHSGPQFPQLKINGLDYALLYHISMPIPIFSSLANSNVSFKFHSEIINQFNLIEIYKTFHSITAHTYYMYMKYSPRQTLYPSPKKSQKS